MDGLARAAGIGPTIQLGGQPLTVNGKILRHMAEIEAEIVRQRGNPFDLIRMAQEALTESAPGIVGVFVTQAFQEAQRWRHVTIRDVDEFIYTTWSGFCFRLWLAVRHNDPAVWTLERVRQAYADQYERCLKADQRAAAANPDTTPTSARDFKASLEDAIDQADGEDELGNSNGSRSSAATESTSPNASPGT